MFIIDLPKLDWSLPARWLVDQAELPNKRAQQVFGGGAMHAFRSPYGEALLHFLAPMISKAIGTEVVGSYSFGWIYPNGGWLAPHLDREEVHWLCSITVEQDEPWVMETAYGNIWQSIPTSVGQATLLDGAKYAHRRPPYTGIRSVSLVLSYDERPAIAERRRQTAGIKNAPSPESLLPAALEMGLEPEMIPGLRKKPQLRHIIIPASESSPLDICKSVRSRVYHSVDDKSEAILYGQAASELLGLQLMTRDTIEDILRCKTGVCAALRHYVPSSDCGVCKKSITGRRLACYLTA